MATGIDDTKATLRSAARQRRGILQKTQGHMAALALRDHVLKAPFMGGDGVVAAYWPTRDEIDCRPLLERMAEQGMTCALPVIAGPGRPLIFRMWQPGTNLVTGHFNVRIPDEDHPVVIPRIVLTPLLAFDQAGYRLGYGGGYYDRSLAVLRRRSADVIACGLAFSGQEVAAVPHDGHDQILDWIITEKEARCCGAPQDSATVTADPVAGYDACEG